MQKIYNKLLRTNMYIISALVFGLSCFCCNLYKTYVLLKPLSIHVDSTYVPETQICCGKFVFDKIGENGKEIKCCGVSPYLPSNNRQICCKQILHYRNIGKFLFAAQYLFLFIIFCMFQNLNLLLHFLLQFSDNNLTGHAFSLTFF